MNILNKKKVFGIGIIGSIWGLYWVRKYKITSLNNQINQLSTNIDILKCKNIPLCQKYYKSNGDDFNRRRSRRTGNR